jgi:tRNA modification GTPase
MSARATYAVVLTPPGRGAVATVLVVGPRAVELTSQLVLRDSSGPPSFEPWGRIQLGRWARTDGEEVVVAALDSNRVEVHCHGGIAASRAVLSALVAAGCEPIDFQTWNSIERPDPIERAALTALTSATTQRAALILLDQYQGALARALAEIRGLVTSADWAATRQAVTNLLARSPIGSHLIQPWRVVVAGPPNVGKSSLVNALVGYQRAIVYDAPGTTRDTVTATIALSGWPVEICDTAGLRQSSEPIEAEGVGLALRAAAIADALVLVFSTQEAWQPDWQEFLDRWPSAIVVQSKCDLPLRPDDHRPLGIPTSSVAGTGLNELETAITTRLVPQEPAVGVAIPFNAEQVELLERMLSAIDHRQADAVLAMLVPWLGGAALQR